MAGAASICILARRGMTGQSRAAPELFFTRLIIPLVFVIFHMLITAIVRCLCSVVYLACKFARVDEKYTGNRLHCTHVLIAQKNTQCDIPPNTLTLLLGKN